MQTISRAYVSYIDVNNIVSLCHSIYINVIITKTQFCCTLFLAYLTYSSCSLYSELMFPIDVNNIYIIWYVGDKCVNINKVKVYSPVVMHKPKGLLYMTNKC